MSLPVLPGNSSSRQLGKERFHKSQHFDFSNGVAMLVGDDKPGIGGERLRGQKTGSKFSVYPRGRGRDLPSWVAFDKQALCFDAFFQEMVHESQTETYRIRKCKIFFYLEDDTIQVVEPEYKNSGIPQGTLIRRQRVPLPPPDDDHFFNVFHFNVDQQMVLHSRSFTVTDCDSFTRNFLTRLGVRVNQPAAVPEDPYSTMREQIEQSMNPLRPYERRDTLKQFLDHDREVLRFSCFWDDSGSVFGDPRELVLHYFLADDTIEILETVPPNSGRDPVSKFLRRSKLPKNPQAGIKQPGANANRTVLNVFSSSRQGKRLILDSLKTGAVHEDFYLDRDLSVGAELNVWGRRVVVTDCDDFTKNYYRSKYGVEDFSPVQYKAPAAPRPPRPVPPYTGFGSEEDSLSSCQGLLPKRPQKDFRKFMEKDSYVLNFRARLVSVDPVDSERAFVVSFHVCDDSISVFERPQRNSGVVGGKFLERGRVKKPGQQLFKSELSEYFTAQDLYVGATVCLNNKNFLLLDADDFTFSYMERHAEEFPKADVGTILSKLRSAPAEKQSEIRKFLTLSDPRSTGFLPYESFRSLLTGLDCGLVEHEVLVLARCFSERQQQEADVGLMLAVAQDHLRKKNFDQFIELNRAFTHQDRHRSGRLPVKEVRTICRACQLPLPEKLLGVLLSTFSDGDQIHYHAFLSGIDWLQHPAPPVTPDDTLQFDVDVRFNAREAAATNVNYSSLLKDVFVFSSSSSENNDQTTTTNTTAT